MKANFQIHGTKAIEFKGRTIDLHNHFDFMGVDECKDDRTLMLDFKKSRGYDHVDTFDRLFFKCSGVTNKKVQDGEFRQFPDESMCLNEIALKPDNGTTESKDLVFRFLDGKTYQIQCSRAEVIAESAVGQPA